MSDWSVIFLGIIALATLLMAAIQVGVIIIGARIAKRLEATVGRLEQEIKPVIADIKPVIANVQAISGEAARISQLATAQVERVDQLVADFSQRADQTMALVQQAIVTPAREGAALFGAVRSTLAAIRGLKTNGHGRQRPPRGVEEDDALFIG